MLKAKIIATGSYVPEKILTNHDLEKLVDTSDEWIMERTGISQRRVAGTAQAASDLACEASLSAIRRSGTDPRDIDLIITATCTGDMPMPSTACLLQEKIGASKAAAFDINAACSGFIYGLHVAQGMIGSGLHKRVLLVGAEVMSRFTDWQDRTTCIIFGDGAGAVLLDATREKKGVLSTNISSDGSLSDLICLPGGGSRNPCSEDTLNNRLNFIKMKGNETFKVAVRTLEETAVKALEENGVDSSQVALLVPHQANIRIIQATAKRLNMPMEKVYVNINRYGNTSAASIPIALDDAAKEGRIREGDYVLLLAFGGGLTWASSLIRW